MPLPHYLSPHPTATLPVLTHLAICQTAFARCASPLNSPPACPVLCTLIYRALGKYALNRHPLIPNHDTMTCTFTCEHSAVASFKNGRQTVQ